MHTNVPAGSPAQLFKKHPPMLVTYIGTALKNNYAVMGEWLREFCKISDIPPELWNGVPDRVFVSPNHVPGIRDAVDRMYRRHQYR